MHTLEAYDTCDPGVADHRQSPCHVHVPHEEFKVLESPELAPDVMGCQRKTPGAHCQDEGPDRPSDGQDPWPGDQALRIHPCSRMSAGLEGSGTSPCPAHMSLPDAHLPGPPPQGALC